MQNQSLLSEPTKTETPAVRSITGKAIEREALSLLAFLALLVNRWTKKKFEFQPTLDSVAIVWLCLDSLSLLVYVYVWASDRNKDSKNQRRMWPIDLLDDLFIDIPIFIISMILLTEDKDWISFLVAGFTISKVLQHFVQVCKKYWETRSFTALLGYDADEV
eukprot:TRINITY_DN3786_c0_g1_i1.p1 TRINITY_DN3786_c0_g1~~TRINITY_DN3786_c0_g1_i1.p1  ORF type:complete len:162 (-),score=18.93 TRINITY_DN3786_c0_g1_i1:93-578(-)